MLLSKETTVRVDNIQSNIVNHLGYAAYKLWNICNYERKTYNSSSGDPYPDWYYQKAAHKDSIWFKNLPSQTAQEVCKQLDLAWKSYFSLLKTGGIQNPRPPRFKHDPIPVTYMQNGIKRLSDTTVRLTLSRALKQHMSDRYGIHENWLIIENTIFNGMDHIKQIKLYMPEGDVMRVIVVYEVDDVPVLPDNGRYLSIDIGLHNLMACYSSVDGQSFIVGRDYLSRCRMFDKEIARVQSQGAAQQAARGVKYPKLSKHVLNLYQKKRNVIRDYLHKCTKYLVAYCAAHGINTIVIGDITGILEYNDKGDRINQQLHGLPFRKMYQMLDYKCALYGIRFIMQDEAYTSQCPPDARSVSRKYSEPKSRIQRGLYSRNSVVYNADCVGAFNILRKYLQTIGQPMPVQFAGLSSPSVIKVAV